MEYEAVSAAANWTYVIKGVGRTFVTCSGVLRYRFLT